MVIGFALAGNGGDAGPLIDSRPLREIPATMASIAESQDEARQARALRPLRPTRAASESVDPTRDAVWARLAAALEQLIESCGNPEEMHFGQTGKQQVTYLYVASGRRYTFGFHDGQASSVYMH